MFFNKCFTTFLTCSGFLLVPETFAYNDNKNSFSERDAEELQRHANDFMRFETKHCLKAPFSLSKDNKVRFWEVVGIAQVSEAYVRLTPAVKGQRGSIWNRHENKFRNWEILVDVKISGRNAVGADGISIWYTSTKGNSGPIYGNIDYWKGLAIILDTYNNDATGAENHIIGVLNDGSLKFNNNDDGESQGMGKCVRQLRNTLKSAKLKIRYQNRKLWVSTDVYGTGKFDPCFVKENINLPDNGFFGVTAATGGLSDDHDLLAFTTFDLDAREKKPHDYQREDIDKAQKDMEEKHKYESQYNEQMESYQKEKTDYEKTHVDEISKNNLAGSANQDVTLEELTKRQQTIMQTIFSVESNLWEAIYNPETYRKQADEETIILRRMEAIESLIKDLERKLGSGGKNNNNQNSGSMTREIGRMDGKLLGIHRRVDSVQGQLQRALNGGGGSSFQGKSGSTEYGPFILFFGFQIVLIVIVYSVYNQNQKQDMNRW